MKKHNIIELSEYKQNKHKVTHEHECFEVLDRLSDRIKIFKTYAKNFKQYLYCMVGEGKIKQQFADNLNQQADLMMMAAAASVTIKGEKQC